MRQLKLEKENMVEIKKVGTSDAWAILEYINIISRESDFLTFGEGQFTKSIKEEEYFIDNISTKNNALFIIAEVEGKIIENLNFSGGTRPRGVHSGEFGVRILKEYWG